MKQRSNEAKNFKAHSVQSSTPKLSLEKTGCDYKKLFVTSVKHGDTYERETMCITVNVTFTYIKITDASKVQWAKSQTMRHIIFKIISHRNYTGQPSLPLIDKFLQLFVPFGQLPVKFTNGPRVSLNLLLQLMYVNQLANLNCINNITMKKNRIYSGKNFDQILASLPSLCKGAEVERGGELYRGYIPYRGKFEF